MKKLESPLCTQTDPELWSPQHPNDNRFGSVKLAKALCRSCVAYDDCLDMFDPNPYAIQAGLTPNEQKSYAKVRDAI